MDGLREDRSAELPYAECEENEHRYLSGECFRGRHSDFGAYVDVGAGVSVARNGCSDNVADAVDEGAFLACELYGGEGVGSFARLRYGDYDVVFGQAGVGVPEFGSVFHLDGYAAHFLYEALSDKGGVP